MPFYQRRGDVPRKRHIVFRENGRLLTEEVMGLEGFTGNESILYHLESPCRVKELGAFTPIEREEWVPEAHAHRRHEHVRRRSERRRDQRAPHAHVELGRRDLAVPAGDRRWTTSSGTERATRSSSSTRARERSRRRSATCPTRKATTSSSRAARPIASCPKGEQRYLVFETPGLIEIPRRYRNQYGQILEGAPYYHRDIHPPTELNTHRDRGEFLVKVRVRGGYQDYVLDYHPFDVVGWDGYLYPWTFSIHDFEPITGRIHQPPPSHQTFQGQNFVICSFCPRHLDFDPEAVPIPYHHSNLQSEEMIYYVSGNFGSRKGISVGSITLHPSGLPHGPAPGLAEKALGVRETTELAVMCDTFRPLKLSTFARDLDDGRYALSWYEPPSEEPDLAGVTSHL